MPEVDQTPKTQKRIYSKVVIQAVKCCEANPIADR